MFKRPENPVSYAFHYSLDVWLDSCRVFLDCVADLDGFRATTLLNKLSKMSDYLSYCDNSKQTSLYSPTFSLTNYTFVIFSLCL